MSACVCAGDFHWHNAPKDCLRVENNSKAPFAQQSFR